MNLRNLGANRTLVLVNGRRHVGGNVGTSAVDLNSIPTGMIERIDMLKRGYYLGRNLRRSRNFLVSISRLLFLVDYQPGWPDRDY